MITQKLTIPSLSGTFAMPAKLSLNPKVAKKIFRQIIL